ncbi:MAG: aminoglycoside phosphotransferase family protein [Chitinophagaceae bacterium]|nr:aminoglycoside phosphotransferase family protein [Chitinophagaceae bacterium]
MQDVLSQYGFSESDCSIQPLGNGLINSTWLLESAGKKYVLQKINHTIFGSPGDIAYNIRLLADHLSHAHPDYLFVSPIRTLKGDDLVSSAEGFFRIFPFINNSHTIDVVEEPEQAYEAAKQFGKFTRLLSGFDAGQLKITLPDFHNLGLRYRQFEEALLNGNAGRIKESAILIDFIKANKNIVDEFERSKANLKIRCIHHDTKISNVLFDEAGKGLCVIDLDTIMPGYFISDVGDMMRTYLSPVSEEEKDLSKIRVRNEYYEAIEQGYLSEMGEELTSIEKSFFHYSGKFMIYMQALRFLTDHLNNDKYYGAKYEGHNFSRAGNQATLLQRLMEFNPG